MRDLLCHTLRSHEATVPTLAASAAIWNMLRGCNYPLNNTSSDCEVTAQVLMLYTGVYIYIYISQLEKLKIRQANAAYLNISETQNCYSE